MYAKPHAEGGTLIRRTIQFLRAQGLALPLDSHILIATSGGPDSTALAVLLSRYGRRVGALERIRLLYVDHGWRPRASAQEKRLLERLASRLGVSFVARQVPGPRTYPKGASWEAEARRLRLAVFEEEARAWGGDRCLVFTGHTREDLAETVLWRLLTGADPTQRGGILARHGRLVRPFLTTSKHSLLAFLREERVRFSVDSSNRDPRFLRARLRRSIWPSLLRLFPKATENLAKLGLDAQVK